jgi:hypothetical protein
MSDYSLWVTLMSEEISNFDLEQTKTDETFFNL